MNRKIGGPSANNEVDAFAPSGGLGTEG